jgi:hypothetical protein
MANTKVAEPVQVVTPVEEQAAPTPEVVQEEPTIVAPATKNARVKGTWTMYYGTGRWDFVDGHRYDLPLDLFQYLKAAGNIYDTAI